MRLLPPAVFLLLLLILPVTHTTVHGLAAGAAALDLCLVLLRRRSPGGAIVIAVIYPLLAGMLLVSMALNVCRYLPAVVAVIFILLRLVTSFPRRTSSLISVAARRFPSAACGILAAIALVTTAAPRRHVMPLSSPLLVNKDIWSVRYSTPKPVLLDELLLVAGMENAYGVTQGKEVARVVVETALNDTIAIPLRAGLEVSDSGRGMPLVQRSLQHGPATPAYWRLDLAEDGQFIFRHVWYSVRTRLPPGTLVSGLRLQYSLNPTIDAQITVREMIGFHHPARGKW